MNKIQRDILSTLKEHFAYTSVLCLTLLFFLYKGFEYLLIGSYIPMILISFIIMLFIVSSHKSEKAVKKTISFWTILIIIWSSIRLLLSIINQFIKPIPESHVYEQLGISGVILSLLFLSGGLYLLIYKKKIFKK